MAAIAWLDRNRSGTVLFFSGSLVISLLLASVGMFVALVQRITALQINNMLAFTGDHGRGII
jgi:type III secretory pathway component EscS